MARPERFELPTNWFEASYSIQLSYGRLVWGRMIACRPGWHSDCRTRPPVPLLGLYMAAEAVIWRQSDPANREITG